MPFEFYPNRFASVFAFQRNSLMPFRFLVIFKREREREKFMNNSCYTRLVPVAHCCKSVSLHSGAISTPTGAIGKFSAPESLATFYLCRQVRLRDPFVKYRRRGAYTRAIGLRLANFVRMCIELFAWKRHRSLSTYLRESYFKLFPGITDAL